MGVNRTCSLVGLGYLLVAMVLIVACKPVPPPVCDDDIKVCPDGSTVGRIPPKCYFSECKPTSGPQQGSCPQTEKQAQYCIELYDPVCANDGKTYGNSCFACVAGVSSWTKGAC